VTNAEIAELLAVEAETSRPPMTKAFRRAARRAHLWPEEATALIQQRRSLTELPGIGPFIEKYIVRWIEDPPPRTITPPIRSGFLTMTQAQAILAVDSSWLTNIKGDLQMHSEWSDGEGSVREMAEAGNERKYEYISITDHSKGLKIAGGIDEAQLRRQSTEIAEVNQSLKAQRKTLRVLRSIEVNLNPAGEVDMERKSLAELDIVLGCFHSALRKKDDQTDRYLAALRNPSVQILGHPRGRIYNFRLGLSAVFDEAAHLDKAVEIDAYPDRQDLSPDLLRLAKKAGCRISFGTDSHGPPQLRFMQFASASALLAGIKRERILNFMTREELLFWVRTIRESSKRSKRRTR
jgi:histidinol phosphatase-like PHP family hydrolase